jgi:hypothetical protein
MARRNRPSKLDQAEPAIRATVRSGNRSAMVVHRAVTSQGISTRTHCTARKQMHTPSVQRSRMDPPLPGCLVHSAGLEQRGLRRRSGPA